MNALKHKCQLVSIIPNEEERINKESDEKDTTVE